MGAMIINTILDSLKNLIYYLPILIISITVHEFSHAFVAKKLGDNTAYLAGRVSLNPLRHLDPVGSICMLLFGFGWGKAVPISVLNFKNPQKDSALVAVAGPLSNLIMACIWAIIFGIVSLFVEYTSYIYIILFYGVYLNCVLCVFNLLPITPLDGSRVLSLILPKRTYFKMIKYEKYFFIVLVILMFTNVLDTAISFLAGGMFTGLEYSFIALGRLIGSIFV